MVQPVMAWEDVDANLEILEGMLGGISPETGLILLPETFSTGFTMQSERFAEGTDGKAVQWMQRISVEKDAFVSGSIICRDKGQIYNRMFWVSPRGIEGHYDKRHLFRQGRENENFIQGQERVIFSLNGFRFLPQICYDLRFPVFTRNRGDYDVILYVANWPALRHPVWETLTRARAIENQSYVLAVNRVGDDGLQVGHLGGTTAVDPTGIVMKQLDNRPGLLSCKLDLEKLRNYRERFPAWKDTDRFSIDLKRD